jgi:hypothetical protein
MSDKALVKSSQDINVKEIVQQFGGKATVLLPPQHAKVWSPLHTPDISVVEFKIEDAHKIGGGYEDGQWVDYYMHSKPQLDTVATYAGIEVLESAPLPSDDPRVFIHQVKMRLLTPTGTRVVKTATKRVDLRPLDEGGTRAERSYDQRWDRVNKYLNGETYYSKKDRKRVSYDPPRGLRPRQKDETIEAYKEVAEAFVREEVKTEMTQARVFGGELAESGAMNRCMRTLMGIKMQWTEEEFKRPVIIITAKVDFSKIGEEALMKQLMLAAFGQLSGEESASPKLLEMMQALDNVVPADIVEEETIELPPDENGEVVEAEVSEIQEEQQINSLPIEEVKQFQGFISSWGFTVPKAQNGLLQSLFGEDVNLANMDKLQAKIAMQYVLNTRKLMPEAGIEGGALKRCKAQEKILAYECYGEGQPLPKWEAPKIEPPEEPMYDDSNLELPF